VLVSRPLTAKEQGMTTKLAELQIVEMLCAGIDPRTGAEIDTPRNPDLDTCRLRYLKLLRQIDRQASRAALAVPTVAPSQATAPSSSTEPAVAATAAPRVVSAPSKFGARWTVEEDRRVRERWDAPSRPSAAIIGHEMGRTEGAIIARLVALELYPDREQARIESDRRNAASRR
jgi:hypothetical protein